MSIIITKRNICPICKRRNAIAHPRKSKKLNKEQVKKLRKQNLCGSCSIGLMNSLKKEGLIEILTNEEIYSEIMKKIKKGVIKDEIS